MESKERSVEESKLERVVEEIRRWRETRTKLGAMPEGLWNEATEVARVLGVYPVMKACGLNYQALEQRVARAEGPGKSRKLGAVRPARVESRSDFVEVSNVPLLSGRSADGSVEVVEVVEVVASDGARLTIRMKSDRFAEAAVLVSAFQERRG